MDENRTAEIKSLMNNELGEKILQKDEDDVSIRVNDIIYQLASGKGDNYASDLFRATFEYTRTKKEKRTMILKVLPCVEGARKELIRNSSVFTTEMSMVTDSLKKMNKLLSPDSPLSGRGLFVQKDPPLLVLQDLAPLGFGMADRKVGLDEDHCLLVIRCLAKFHGSSVALCEKEPDQKEKYKIGLFTKNQSEEILMFIVTALKNLGKDIVNWPELDPKLSEKILNFADVATEKADKALEDSKNEFCVINHGDAWVNNIMFKYNDQNKPIDVRFVDFQLCNYCTPAADLHYFLNTSVPDKYLMENEDKLLKEYVSVLSATMTKLGCRTKAPTFNELKKILKDTTVIGALASLVIMPIVTSDEDAMDEEELFAGNESMNAIFKNKVCRDIIIRRLPIFDELGIFD